MLHSYYCPDEPSTVLWEEWMYVHDLGVQLKPVIERCVLGAGNPITLMLAADSLHLSSTRLESQYQGITSRQIRL